MSIKQYLVLISVFLIAYFVFVESFRKFCFEEICFDVIIANDQEKRREGLSGYLRLENNQGMFFVFPEENYQTFWMKDMKFPIDIIFLNNQYRVVDIKKGFQPNSYPEIYTPKEKAQYVLEVETGKYSIDIGEIGYFIP